MAHTRCLLNWQGYMHLCACTRPHARVSSRMHANTQSRTHTQKRSNTFCFSMTTMIGENASMLRYTYIDYLLYFPFFFRLFSYSIYLYLRFVLLSHIWQSIFMLLCAFKFYHQKDASFLSFAALLFRFPFFWCATPPHWVLTARRFDTKF